MPTRPAPKPVLVPEQWTRQPQPSPSSGRKPLIIGAIVAAAVIVVGVVGAVIYFSLHHAHEVAGAPAPTTSVSLAATPQPGVATTTAGRAAPAAQPAAVASTPAQAVARNTTASAASASASASAPTAAASTATTATPTAMSPAAPAVTAAPIVAQAPAAPVVNKPVVPSGPTRTQQIAIKLTDKAEIEFGKQNYTAAIANAKAALELWPEYRRAHVLLGRAERAQQAAMNSIEVH